MLTTVIYTSDAALWKFQVNPKWILSHRSSADAASSALASRNRDLFVQLFETRSKLFAGSSTVYVYRVILGKWKIVEREDREDHWRKMVDSGETWRKRRSFGRIEWIFSGTCSRLAIRFRGVEWRQSGKRSVEGPHALDNTAISSGQRREKEQEEEEDEEEDEVEAGRRRGDKGKAGVDSFCAHCRPLEGSVFERNARKWPGCPFFSAACRASHNCDLRATGQLRPGDNAAATPHGQSNNLDPAVTLPRP